MRNEERERKNTERKRESERDRHVTFAIWSISFIDALSKEGFWQMKKEERKMSNGDFD